jgi:hypothetical protein
MRRVVRFLNIFLGYPSDVTDAQWHIIEPLLKDTPPKPVEKFGEIVEMSSMQSSISTKLGVSGDSCLLIFLRGEQFTLALENGNSMARGEGFCRN